MSCKSGVRGADQNRTGVSNVTSHPSRFRWILALLALVACLAAGTAKAHRLSGKPRTLQARLKLAERQVAHDRRELAGLHRYQWRILSPLPLVAVVHMAMLARDVSYVAQLSRLLVPWPAWWLSGALCVHSKEGSWVDPNAPYYGGMQFDQQTWLANGGGRFASFPHYASPRQQLTVAYWTWLRRGWHPWPNTARACGLL